MVVSEIDEANLTKNCIFDQSVSLNNVIFTFDFKPNADPQFSFNPKYDVSFTQLTGIIDITRVIITVNGVGVFDGTVLTSPLILRANDVVHIRVYKGFYNNGIFKLIGNTI